MALTDKQQAYLDRQLKQVQAKIQDHRTNRHPSVIAAEQAAKALAGDKRAAEGVEYLIEQGNGQARPVANTYGTFNTPEGVQVLDADELIKQHVKDADGIVFHNHDLNN